MSGFRRIVENKLTPIYEKLEFEACKVYTRSVNPIYFYHIRKTGGTSINGAFLKHFGFNFPEDYKLLSEKHNNRLLKKGKVIIGWNAFNIGTGAFHYAFSHHSYDRVEIPKTAFRFTCLRDPMKRVASHYKMLHHYKSEGIEHPSFTNESEWIGDSFEEFLNKIPPEHLNNQLHMFSNTMNIEQAVERIKNLDHYFFNEDFVEGMQNLGRKLSTSFEILREKSFNYKFELDDNEIALLKSKLEDEYKMITLLK